MYKLNSVLEELACSVSFRSCFESGFYNLPTLSNVAIPLKVISLKFYKM